MSALAVSNLVLWGLVIGLSLVVLALARQLGVVHERIAPVGALMLGKGLKVGELVPVVDVVDLEARPLSLGAPRSDQRDTLIVFVSPTCPVCKALLPVLKATRRSAQGELEVVLASDGDLAEQQAFVREQGLEAFAYVVSTPLGMTFQVSRLPFAALIDSQGVLRARGLINSREHLESLLEAKRLGVASLQEYLEAHARSRAA